MDIEDAARRRERRAASVEDVVETDEVELAAKEDLGRLLLGRQVAPPAKVLERHTSAFDFRGDGDGGVDVQASEEQVVGQDEHVRGESMPAEVRALHSAVAERTHDRCAVQRAARITRPVRADEKRSNGRKRTPHQQRLRAIGGDEACIADGVSSPRARADDDLPSAHVRRRSDELFAERTCKLRAPHVLRTTSGKYGGASRNPTRGAAPARPRAICNAAPIPTVGTKPSVRAAS